MAPAGEWPGTSQAIDSLGMHIYSLTSGFPGALQVFDASNPPFELGSFNTPGFRLDIDVIDYGGLIGKVGYITDGTAIRTVDVDDPGSITPLDTFDILGPSFAVNTDIAANLGVTYAYVAAGAGGMQILDGTDPSNLTPLGTFPSTVASDIAVKDTWGFLADGASGLRILDLANPMMPTQAGIYDTPDSARAVEVSGEVAFVADSSSLLALDIANPVNIRLLSQWPAVESVQDVDLWNQYVVIADGRGGVRAFTFGPNQSLDEDIGGLLLGEHGDTSGIDLNGDGVVDVRDIVALTNERQ
jgi:hypothetical protein